MVTSLRRHYKESSARYVIKQRQSSTYTVNILVLFIGVDKNHTNCISLKSC